MSVYVCYASGETQPAASFSSAFIQIRKKLLGGQPIPVRHERRNDYSVLTFQCAGGMFFANVIASTGDDSDERAMARYAEAAGLRDYHNVDLRYTREEPKP
jgi:hypothetical protein